MTLFRSTTHRDVWKMRWCETCFEKHEAARRIQGKADSICPIWERAIRTDRKPPEWERNTRTDEMQRSIKCNSYQPRPMRIVKAEQQCETEPMFDLEPADFRLIPVEGWPDKPEKDTGPDHA